MSIFPIDSTRTPAHHSRWLAALMGLLIACSSVAQMLPTSMPHYRLLQQALVHYRALAADATLTQLPPLPRRAVRSGEAYEGSDALRRLLEAMGDMPPPQQSRQPAVLDSPLADALRNFQRRHGLMEDGVLGPATWRALTTPLTHRVNQIERTLQRWEQLPPNPGTRTLFINIPQFRLIGLHSAEDSEAQMLRMDVVVGRNERGLRTPTMITELTDVVFHPYWEVPASITRRELLPLMRSNPAYLQDHHMEIVAANGSLLPANAEALEALASGRARIRQRPGKDNALGRVKFILTDDMAIFLHDTPATALFARPRRAFSHGCVRVADPVALAQFALQDDPTWPLERIQAMMDGDETLRVKLPAPIRVYVVYGTALALENGEVRFFDDVYGLDAARQPVQARTRPVSRCTKSELA
jgi:murein L,D-transpeptidase YcbB/YkuD